MQWAVAGHRVEDHQYTQFERLLHKLAHRYHRQFGGDYDDYISEANLAFVYASRSYDPNRSDAASFSCYLYHVVCNKLYQAVQRVIKDSCLCQLDAPLPQPTKDPKQWIDTQDALSTDAKEVCRLVLDAGSDYVRLVQESSRRNYKGSLKEYLKKFGWTKGRIARAFSEIERIW